MVQIRFPLELKTYINMMNYKIPFIFYRKKKTEGLEPSVFIKYWIVLITQQQLEQLEQLVETHQQLDLEGSCERYARA